MTGQVAVTRAAASVVATVAGYVSYLHIVDVAMAVGERPEVAYALPVTVDALMVMATLALLSDRRNRWAQAGFLFGVSVSVTCNVASAAPTWPARGVAAIPAVALLLAVEILVRSGRPAPAPASGHGHTSTRQGGQGGQRPPRPRSRTGRGDGATRVAAAMAAAPEATVAELARLAGVSRSTVRRHANGHQVASTSTTGSTPGG